MWSEFKTIMAENKTQEFKVLITTSGVGQRLGELMKYTNKALVRIGKKPAISYVIEAYPEHTQFVIVLGYYSNQIKDFIRLAYPKLNVEFIEVDNYQGAGSSLGYSMLQAKDALQCPFIFHACDTVVMGNIPSPTVNWIGGFKGSDTSQYSSFKSLHNKVISFNDKGAIDFDYIHIGLVGIHDYHEYWKTLAELYKKNSQDQALNDCRVIEKMLAENYSFKVVDFPTWFDIGNSAALDHARKNIFDHFDNLTKVDESIFLFDTFVIKFFYDDRMVRDRVERARILEGLVPGIEGMAGNFYRYGYREGDLYSRVVTPLDFVRFLDWADKNLWKDVKETEQEEFKKICYDFYYHKTNERVQRFLQENSFKDEEHIINDERVPSVAKLMEMIDFDWLSEARQQRIHGDFILDNIVRTLTGYCLLDWRQNFGGLLKAGDIYYDFAKLNHNLVVNHDIVNRNLFSVDVDKNVISCDILRKENLVSCQKALFDFMGKGGYDSKKVRILTALIWLNMSPLHHYPFNLFLYYFGKLNLWRALKS